MARQAFVQQITKHVIGATSEVGTKSIGKQQSRTARGWADEHRRRGLGVRKTDGSQVMAHGGGGTILVAPVIVGGIGDAGLKQVRLQ